MKKINAASFVTAIAVAMSLAAVVPALAQTNVNIGVGAHVGVQGPGGIHNGANGGFQHGGMSFGIFGSVTVVNGNTLTVVSGGRPMDPMRPMPEHMTSSTPPIMASTTYTVDATNAKIYKGGATTTVSVSNIAVGDTVIVQGAVSGTNVTATVIHDGVIPMTMGQPGKRFSGRGSSSTPSTSWNPSSTVAFQGNGEPVIGGNVTGISGTTITVTNASNVTYTINAASSTVMRDGTSTAVGTIAVGDGLIVQGTVNGNAVTASSIIDQGAKGTNGSSTKPEGGGFGFGFGGFFGAIGGFFQHLFGF